MNRGAVIAALSGAALGLAATTAAAQAVDNLVSGFAGAAKP